MIKIIRTENITQDITPNTLIEGKILKINIKSSNPLPDVFIQIETEDNELLFSGLLENKNMNIYPIHEIVQGDIKKTEKFYSFGQVFLKVRGLKEGEKIDCIKILYEYNQITRISNG